MNRIVNKSGSGIVNKSVLWRKIKKQLVWYSFIIATIACLLVLTYTPMLTTIKYSFYKISVLGYGETFIGLKNYTALLRSSGFNKSIVNTIILAALNLTVIPLGLILASLINGLGKTRAQSFYRIGFYLPNIITGVSVVLIFQIVLKADGGILNRFLSYLFQNEIKIGWLSDSSIAKLGASIISTWSGLGYAMLINLAGLQSIPREIYEASEVDGCNRIQKWLHITIPQMNTTFIFLVTTNLISSFSRFTDLYILGQNSASGRPGGSLQSILMYVYQFSFETPNYGVSSAGAIILVIIIFTVMVVNLKFTGFFKKGKE